jgi:hypothetical protein
MPNDELHALVDAGIADTNPAPAEAIMLQLPRGLVPHPVGGWSIRVTRLHAGGR